MLRPSKLRQWISAGSWKAEVSMPTSLRVQRETSFVAKSIE